MKPLPKQIRHLQVVKDLGQQYPKPNYTKKYRMAIFKCLCGKEFTARVDHVKSGSVQSCGCRSHLQKKRRESDRTGATTKYIGITYDSTHKKYTGELGDLKATIGYYNSPADAAIVRDALIIMQGLDLPRNF